MRLAVRAQAVRPIAVGRSKWPNSPGRCRQASAAALRSLIRPAMVIGIHRHAYLKDVLQRLPTHKARLVGELLPRRLQPVHQDDSRRDSRRLFGQGRRHR